MRPDPKLDGHLAEAADGATRSEAAVPANTTA